MTEHRPAVRREESIVYRPIGIVHTPYSDPDGVPVQGIFSSEKGTVEVFPEYVSGLAGIEGFSHLILIYHFHRAGGCELVRAPFLGDGKKQGIFAIRHYNRPNPVGLSIVRLESVCGNVLEVSGVDILDGTPLLDIKPYVSQFDRREHVLNGWVDEHDPGAIRDRDATPRSLRTGKIERF